MSVCISSVFLVVRMLVVINNYILNNNIPVFKLSVSVSSVFLVTLMLVVIIIIY